MEILKEVKFIVVHNSGNHNSFEKIKNLHVNVNGWEDIGYHWLINKDGNLIKGRSEKFIGAHVFGHNKNSIAVCLIGNLEKSPPTKKQIETLIKFLKQKIKKHNLSVENILGHKEMTENEKMCPGKFVDLEKIRALVSA